MISLLAIVVSLGVAAAVNGEHFYRLPDKVIPKHYNVELSVDVQTGSDSYGGKVQILVEVVEPTSEIVLHASGLDIGDVRLLDQDGNGDDHLQLMAMEENELLKIWHDRLLNMGSYRLEIRFNGTTSTTYKGMLLESYLDTNGTEKYLLSTDFEPTEARTVFPCFDEPALKATFNISIVHHSSLKALSNMPLDGVPLPYSSDQQDYVISRFQQTPKMSTHSLIFVVADFAVYSDGNTSIYARAEVIDNFKYIVALTNDVLNALDMHTGLPHTTFLPNITHVLLPVDRSFSRSTETWGLISFQERYVAYNSAVNGFQGRSEVFQIVARELAHQWFRNLVTPAWWNHVWMKEGLATLYQYYGLHLAYPQERFMDLYNIDSLQMNLQMWSNMNPTFMNETVVCAPDDYYIELVSGSVLNMVRLIIGDENWQSAMRNYLKSNQFGSTVPEDLYAAIEKFSSVELNLPPGISLQQVFDSWFCRAETVLLNVDRQYSKNRITVSQITTNGPARFIPYNYAHDSTHFDHILPIQWLTTSNETIATNNVSDNQWIIFNKRQFGLYRVNYDDRSWRMIIQALHHNFSSIDPLNRVQLLDDAHHLFNQQRLNIELFLDLLSFVRKETDSVVWYKAIAILQDVKRWGQPLYKEFVENLTAQSMERISSRSIPEYTSHLDSYIHANIARLSCWAGNRFCRNYAKENLALAIRTGPSSIPPDWSLAVYCYGLYESNDADFDWVIEKYLQTHSPREEALYVVGFGCAGSTGRLKRALETILEKHKFNPQLLRKNFQQITIALSTMKIDGQFENLLTLLGTDQKLVQMIGSEQINLLLRQMRNMIGSEKQRTDLQQMIQRLNASILEDPADNVPYNSHIHFHLAK